jgi:hypothetical protein
MKKFLFIIITINLLLFFGCDSSNSITQSDEKGNFNLRMTRETIPENVHSIEAQLSSEAETLTADFDMESDPVEAEFSNLQVGNWNLSVSAFDTGNNLVFFGETEVTINSGINYANVEMNPVGGNLIVNLTWNENGVNEEENYVIVFTADDPNNIRNVYRYNLESNEFVQITTEGNSTFPEYMEDLDKIVFQRWGNIDILTMDIDGSNIQEFGHFTFAGIQPEYCLGNQMFYYYYIGNDGYRDIVAENPLTGEIMTVPGGDYNNRGPEPNEDGTQILYVSDRSGIQQIYKYDFETNSDTQLTFGENVHSQPTWKKDYSAYYYKSLDTMSIYKYDLSTETTTTILSDIEGESFCFEIDPDEEYIALTIRRQNYAGNFYMYNMQTQTYEQISESGTIYNVPRWIKY